MANHLIKYITHAYLFITLFMLYSKYHYSRLTDVLNNISLTDKEIC